MIMLCLTCSHLLSCSLTCSGLQAQRHGAGGKALPKGGAAAPAAHRRALSEVGNLVEHATQSQRMDKE